MINAAIPSPSAGTWWIGPLPIRAYGLIMVLAMFIAAWITVRRYKARGGAADAALDAIIWAIPFGLVGARFYHVITHPTDYFGAGINPLDVFKVWEGGMAVFGAIAFGALGAVIGLRRAGQRVGPFGDSLAPALLIAQAVGRLGNYFNQELFGEPTTLPWGLRVSDAALASQGLPEGVLVHPLFLYEALWNLAMAAVLLLIDRFVRVKSGQLMALYLVAYGVGRFLMETMRLDTDTRIFGIRVNMLVAILIAVAGIIVYFICGKVNASTKVLPEEKQAYLDRLEDKEGGTTSEKPESAEDDPDADQPDVDEAAEQSSLS